MYEVKVYDKDKKVIHSDYYDCIDKQQAEERAKDDCKCFGSKMYSVRQLRFLQAHCLYFFNNNYTQTIVKEIYTQALPDGGLSIIS